MAWRFRKQIKIFPGIKLNLTKNGISSVSLGPKGAKVNLSPNGVKVTNSLIGSGISHQVTFHPTSAFAPSCPLCGNKLSEGQLVCSSCGKRWLTKCDTCGTVICKGAKFCSKCGQPIPPEKYVPYDVDAEAAARQRVTAEAEQAKEDARIAKEQAKEAALLAKEQAKEEARLAKEAEKQAAAAECAKNQAIKSFGNSILGTLFKG